MLGTLARKREVEFLLKLQKSDRILLCHDEWTDMLHDLEEYGFITSEPTEPVGGHAADKYTLTDKGRQFLSEMKK